MRMRLIGSIDPLAVAIHGGTVGRANRKTREIAETRIRAATKWRRPRRRHHSAMATSEGTKKNDR